MLGKSETIGTYEDLFTPLNKKFKIFSRKKKIPGSFRIPDISPLISPAIISPTNSVTTISPTKNYCIATG